MSQKSENLLNLALEATEEERMKSLELEVGYHPIEKEWDLIVKYSGSLSEIRKTAVSVTELMNGYAVLTIEEKQIENLARFPEIEFIEKPKRLFFEAENGRRVSCIDSVQRPPLSRAPEPPPMGRRGHDPGRRGPVKPVKKAPPPSRAAGRGGVLFRQGPAPRRRCPRGCTGPGGAPWRKQGEKLELC